MESIELRGGGNQGSDEEPTPVHPLQHAGGGDRVRVDERLLPHRPLARGSLQLRLGGGGECLQA